MSYSNFTAYTLVDITNTNHHKSTVKKHRFLQQQNLNTLIQTIGLRSQPLEPSVDQLMTQDIAQYGFGNEYKGLHTVWRLNFSIEHSKVFALNTNKTHYLDNDSDGIAIYTGLEESAYIKTRAFETFNVKLVNLYFKYHSSDI